MTTPKSIKVELHLHTSRYSACAAASPRQMMARLVRLGCDAAYITEHDSVWSDLELAELRAEFPGLLIFPGLELTLGDIFFQHLLVLGTNDPAYLGFSSPVPALAKARAAGHLTVLAHPFRYDRAAAMLDDGNLPDAIEYHTCNHDAKAAERSEIVAEELELPLVNASDAHNLGFLGRFWIETARPIVGASDIRGIILDGAYTNCMEGSEPA